MKFSHELYVWKLLDFRRCNMQYETHTFMMYLKRMCFAKIVVFKHLNKLNSCSVNRLHLKFFTQRIEMPNRLNCQSINIVSFKIIFPVTNSLGNLLSPIIIIIMIVNKLYDSVYSPMTIDSLVELTDTKKKLKLISIAYKSKAIAINALSVTRAATSFRHISSTYMYNNLNVFIINDLPMQRWKSYDRKLIEDSMSFNLQIILTNLK